MGPKMRRRSFGYRSQAQQPPGEITGPVVLAGLERSNRVSPSDSKEAEPGAAKITTKCAEQPGGCDSEADHGGHVPWTATP